MSAHRFTRGPWKLVLLALAAVTLAAIFVLAPGGRAHSATIPVTRTDDPAPDGCAPDDCSLREAIIAANASPGADAITLPAGTYTLSIPGMWENSGATGDLDITDALTLTGAGPEATIIDGGALDRVLDVMEAPGDDVTVAGVTIQNGRPCVEGGCVGGGAIHHQTGSLAVNDSVIASSTGGFGGGISNEGSLTLTNTSITNNAQEGLGCGGGIGNLGVLTLIGSTVSDNTTVQFGGGICNGDGATLTLDGSVVSGNAAESAGGGIFNSGGDVMVTESTIRDNTVTGIGGGVHHSLGGDLTVTASTISNNHALFEGGGILASFNSGQEGTLTLMDSTIDGNSGGAGGGTFTSGLVPTITRTTVSNNSGFSGGGSYFSETSGATVSNSTYSGNRASTDGGGIMADVATVSLNNVTITGNRADSDGDGTGDGGGVNVSGGSSIFSVNSIIAGNIDLGGEAPDCMGTLDSNGHNLIENLSGCVIAGDTTGNIIGQDPTLGPLADNGGLTKTHALQDGSPAINAGSPDCPPPATDQRGVARPQGAVCDIGSYEFGPAVGGIAELANVEGALAETSGSSGPRAGVLAGIGSAVAACAVALGGMAWYVRRRHT